MVATESAVLPWSRQSIAGDPPPAPRRSNEPQSTALNAPDADGDDFSFKPFGKDGFSFLDLIDVINPLQHVPLIGTLYRQITGDTIDPLPRIAGSTLFFGPIGAAFAGANVVVEQFSGQDVGDHIMTALKSGGVGLSTAAAETAPPHAVSVISSKPAAAGTDGAFGNMADDPVSAWARGELAYRAELARGRDVAELARGRELAAASDTSPAAAASANAIPVTTDPARLSWANNPLVEPQPATAETAARSSAPDITRFTQAMGLVDPASVAQLAERTKTMQTVEPRHAARAYRQAGREEERQPARTTATPGEGAIAAGGGWFASNMMDGLQRYREQKAEAPAGMSQAIN
jgi:hypothetical protein